MDQKNQLPRVSLQVCDRPVQVRDVVTKLAEAAVAVEAQYPAHGSGAMVMIDVFGVRCVTDGTEPALTLQHLVERRLRQAIATAQVVLARAAVQTLPRLLAAGVMTWLAVPPVA